MSTRIMLHHLILAGFAILVSVTAIANGQHPRIYASAGDREQVKKKISTEAWAANNWQSLQKELEPYVNRHQQDPDWIVSRLAMYWKKGEHYTQGYVRNENFDYGTGNAPVPTVRLPGMRTWNEYINVPLENRTPFNESGDMLAVSKKNPEGEAVLVPYRKSGHLVRLNNTEILSLAEKAAFAYWLTGEEKYAKFSSDITWAWLLGVYYMNPPLDPEKHSGGPGGYLPGGIMGYYDYEVIHDDQAMAVAASYDFLYDYLNKHPHKHLKATGKSVTDLAGTVFKRFIEINMVRGGKSGNWNINGWNLAMRPILVLETNDYYKDGRGQEYYLQYFTTTSTNYHDALPDFIKDYDKVTGLWSESPGYALSTIAMLLDLAIPIYKQGVDVIESNPMLQKAALAIFPWLDARGNTIVFGDGRGGPANYAMFERLLTYYTWKGDNENAAIAASAIRKGLDAGHYDRSTSGWVGLCVNVPTVPQPENREISGIRTAYSVVHRHITMKNGNQIENGLMATLYGGYPKKLHLNPNGLAMQLYGKGWALAPDASGYESYWSDDFSYHQTVTGSNTIVPGYEAGPVTVNAMEPAPAPGNFINEKAISPYASFSDVSAGEKRRVISIIRTSPSTGYYVDVFRSDQDNNDYIFHNLGNTLTLKNESGTHLPLAPASDLGTSYHQGYRYFKNQQKAAYTGDLYATWTITATSPSISMGMWMKGQQHREVYQVEAPYTNLNKNVTPNGVNTPPGITPTIIIRQNGNNAWKAPFVAVFEPYEGAEKSVQKITALASEDRFVGLLVESKPLNQELRGRKEYILQAVDETVYAPATGIRFSGMYGIAAENEQGFQYLYLGKGRLLQKGKYKLETTGAAIAAGLNRKEEGLAYAADGEVEITIPHHSKDPAGKFRKLRLYYLQDGHYIEASGSADASDRTVTGKLPAGYDVLLKVAPAGEKPTVQPGISSR
ncbi:hypothetical protein [Botryobacter ruber]|uniref:hypothetical protein n=1 Tax=Botryobacter ruber TaxID=2171629 RepID=UPI00196AA8AE|nr:hypothetical protein [Botryobacter ruber]